MFFRENDFIHDEVLNDDTLVEVTTYHVSINTNIQTTEPTFSMYPPRLDTSTLVDSPLAHRRSTRPLHTPSS